MARGGRRKGTPGKSYANRKDLNVDRAPQPGSSATPPAAPPVAQQPQEPVLQPISPDSFPNLTDPTNRPDEPLTAGMDVGPGPGANLAMQVRQWSPLIADALYHYPGDPDLLRMASYLRKRGGR